MVCKLAVGGGGGGGTGGGGVEDIDDRREEAERADGRGGGGGGSGGGGGGGEGLTNTGVLPMAGDCGRLSDNPCVALERRYKRKLFTYTMPVQYSVM